MAKPILKNTKKYYVNEDVELSGNKTISVCLKKEAWFQKLTEENQNLCRDEFVGNFQYDGLDRWSFLIPNTLDAQQLVIKGIQSLLFI